jgi:hypothetical protein
MGVLNVFGNKTASKTKSKAYETIATETNPVTTDSIISSTIGESK